jgi:hypothetical protein
MRIALLFAALLSLPVIGNAKGETVRIEITQGSRSVLVLAGPQSAGQFTIWSGPGTSWSTPDGRSGMSTSPRDYADWAAGAVDPPGKLTVYQVRFHCATPKWRAAELGSTQLCYGVRYAVDSKTGQGYFQIPPQDDKEFPFGDQKIARGVEGSWYRASARWEELVRPAIDQSQVAAR